MSLKSTFLAFKKVVQVVQIWGRGVEVIWTKPKRTATFFVKRSLRLAPPDIEDVKIFRIGPLPVSILRTFSK